MRRSFILRKEVLIALNVAEKNSVSKSVTEILSKNNFKMGNSYSKFNPVYKFDYKIKDQNYEMNFTSVRGHLINYDYPRSLKLWNINKIIKLYEEIPIPKIKSEDLPIKINLQKLGKKADLLILWLDCDREGENIAFEVINVVKKENPTIKILRARFSALTEKDIIFSIENLQEPNKNLSDAVELRQKIDLLLGASFTRLQTLYFRKIFEKYIDSKEIKKFSKPSYENNYTNKSDIDVDGNKTDNKNYKNFYKNHARETNFNMIISYGPCQFPTLNFIVERDEEIKNFVSKNFYSLVFKLNKKLSQSEINLLQNSNHDSKRFQNGFYQVDFEWAKERVDEKEIAVQICDKLQKAFKSDKNHLKVIEAKKKNKIKSRPIPLNTVEMQKLCSRKLKIQSYRTMTIAEKLYNLGYISYPRTETQVYSKNENLKKKVQDLISNANNDNEYDWIPYAKSLLSGGKNLIPKEGKLNDNSHPPISPVKFAKKSDLSNDEFKIYNLLVSHFLATISEDAYGEETDVKVSIDDEIFKARGFNLIKKGYLAVYPYEEWNDKFIPEFKKDEIINYEENSKFEVTEGKTKPPAQMSEAELIELMDKNGIGTDATIHEHIKTIKERNYAVQTGSVFRPTIFGLALIKSYQSLNIEIYKPSLRAALEKDLIRVCKGELETKETFIKMRDESKKFFEIVQNNITTLQTSLENYLANGIKNDDYIKLAENVGNESSKDNEMTKIINENVINVSYNEENIGQNKKKLINEKIDFSKELEESEKLKAEADEIIQSIKGINDKDIKKKDKLKFENNLRGILKMSRKKMESDSTETEDDSNDINELNNYESNYPQKDLLALENKCPSCKTSNLKLIKNKQTSNYFIGCSGFPKCTFNKSINNPSKVKVSNDFCPKCKENNRKNLMYELEFINLKNKNDNILTKEKCFACLLENDPKIKLSNAENEMNIDKENKHENIKNFPYRYNYNSNYKNNFNKRKFNNNQNQNE